MVSERILIVYNLIFWMGLILVGLITLVAVFRVNLGDDPLEYKKTTEIVKLLNNNLNNTV